MLSVLCILTFPSVDSNLCLYLICKHGVTSCSSALHSCLSLHCRWFYLTLAKVSPLLFQEFSFCYSCAQYSQDSPSRTTLPKSLLQHLLVWSTTLLSHFIFLVVSAQWETLLLFALCRWVTLLGLGKAMILCVP